MKALLLTTTLLASTLTFANEEGEELHNESMAFVPKASNRQNS